MPIHLIKLCVGVEEVGQLRSWTASHKPIVHTRQTPKRAAEILEGGGSLYWVIRGQILVRQPILKIETIDSGKGARCEILLGKPPVLTAPAPRRAFQGWRYFEAVDAPPDLPTAAGEAIPSDLAAQLRSIGAW